MAYIYKITNIINNKSYIGQTINFERRIKEHQVNSFNMNAIDYDVPIHKAIRKYGVNNFTFEIIETVSQEKLNNREIYWISYYDTYFSGYNATLGGDGRQCYSMCQIVELWNNGYSIIEIANIIGCHRATVRNYLSEANIPINERQARKIKPIYQYDLKGNFIKKWNSTLEASMALDCAVDSLKDAVCGKRKTCKGYLWRRTYLPNIIPFNDLRGANYKQEDVLEFINRRFQKDCHWLDSNCYWFAEILHQRFPISEIVYDTINGHFMCKICNKFYDYTGIVDTKEKIMPLWLIQLKDYIWYERLIRDCML